MREITGFCLALCLAERGTRRPAAAALPAGSARNFENRKFHQCAIAVPRSERSWRLGFGARTFRQKPRGCEKIKLTKAVRGCYQPFRNPGYVPKHRQPIRSKNACTTYSLDASMLNGQNACESMKNNLRTPRVALAFEQPLPQSGLNLEIIETLQ